MQQHVKGSARDLELRLQAANAENARLRDALRKLQNVLRRLQITPSARKVLVETIDQAFIQPEPDK
jgi:predicted RNA binding protein with dsRBD fold (UPF0201 family)